MQKLLIAINEFYKIATSNFKKIAQQNNLYSELVSATHSIKDPEIASEVELISELYKKALQLNNGFSYVNEVISRFINMLEVDTEGEQEAIEDLINKVSRDLRQRAKNNSDTTNSVQQLKQDKSNFQNQLIDDTTQALNGKVDLEQAVNVNGLFGNQYGEGINSGVSFTAPKTYKDWITAYQDERDRYQEELNSPELWQAKDRQGSAVRNNLFELIKVLDQLISVTKQTNQLYASLSVQENPDKSDQDQFTALGQKTQEFQNKRIYLKKLIRKYLYSKNAEEINKNLSSANNPQEKRLLQAKSNLLTLQISNDYNKAEETKWRKFLVRALIADPNLSEKQINEINDKINLAKLKTIPYKVKHEEKSKDIAKLKGQKAQTTDDRARGAHTDRYDFDNISLDGLITHLTQRLATERQTAKEKVAKAIEDAKLDPNVLKPYIDDLAKAATKKDKAAILEKTKLLRNKMKEIEKSEESVIIYSRSIRTGKFFYQFRDQVSQIQTWENAPLNPEQMATLNEAINQGQKIIDFYTNKDLKTMNNDIIKKKYYSKPLEIVQKITNRLLEIKKNNSFNIEANLLAKIIKWSKNEY